MDNLINDLLDGISPEEHLSMGKEMQAHFDYLEQLKKDGRIFSTNTSISLDIMRSNGFNPIAITRMSMEETFVFKSASEADQAYNMLEVGLSLVSGWWYQEDDFLLEYNSYCEDNGYSPKIYHLDGI